jgi:hypothetical protein
VTRKIIASLTASFTAILLYCSCAKIDTTDLGSDLIPAVDNVKTFETVLDVTTDNKLFNDTTRMLYSTDHGVGIIENDAEFGKTTATLYASFTPPTYRSYPFVKRDSVVIDSVVLSLAYTKTYGDSTSVQQFEVREIDPAVNFTDSLYFLNSPDFPVLPGLVGSGSVNFLSLNDSVRYKNGKDTVRTANELRIKLDTSWARRFVNYDTSNAYNNDTAFKQKFRGFEVKASESSQDKKALAYFSLDDNSRTRITFYCRIKNNGITDTIAPNFTYTTDPHANIIRRTPAYGYLANITNGVDNDDKLYIQAAPGSYAKIKIPGLDTLSNRVIHRAELIIEKYPSQEDFYAPPDKMFIDAISSTGDSAFTIRNDFVPVNGNPGYDINLLGGTFKSNMYVFNLSRYVQSIITKGFPNYTLKIYAPFTTQPYYMPPNSNQASRRLSILLNTPVGAGRVVLYGGASTNEKKMRLRIIYSKI